MLRQERRGLGRGLNVIGLPTRPLQDGVCFLVHFPPLMGNGERTYKSLRLAFLGSQFTCG